MDGGRGEVSRLGHKPAGLEVCAQSWSGAVRVRLYVNEEDVDCALVELTTHHGKGTRATLYDGPVNPGVVGVSLTLGRCVHVDVERIAADAAGDGSADGN